MKTGYPVNNRFLITGYLAAGKNLNRSPIAIAVIEMEIAGYPGCSCGYDQITATATSSHEGRQQGHWDPRRSDCDVAHHLGMGMYLYV
jgi:hypothetical protein